jgi:hypothetical protein
MPRSASWLKKIEEIKSRVEANPSFAYDRADIAKLFNLSQTAAAHVLDIVDAEKKGGALLVPHARLVAFLEGRAEADTACKEQERRKALAERLAERRAAGSPLVAVLPASPRVENSLPAAVTVTGPGRAEIAYDSPEDFLGVIFALAEFADVDPAGFVDSLNNMSSEGDEGEEED